MTTSIVAAKDTTFNDIAKEITVSTDGVIYLSQRGTARLLGVADSTVGRALWGAAKSSENRVAKLGNHLQAMGFEFLPKSGSKRGTQIEVPMLIEICKWYRDVKNNGRASIVLDAFTLKGANDFLKEVKEQYDSEPAQPVLPYIEVNLALPQYLYATPLELMVEMGYSFKAIVPMLFTVARALSDSYQQRCKVKPLKLCYQNERGQATSKQSVYMRHPANLRAIVRVMGYTPE